MRKIRIMLVFKILEYNSIKGIINLLINVVLINNNSFLTWLAILIMILWILRDQLQPLKKPNLQMRINIKKRNNNGKKRNKVCKIKLNN